MTMTEPNDRQTEIQLKNEYNNSNKNKLKEGWDDWIKSCKPRYMFTVTFREIKGEQHSVKRDTFSKAISDTQAINQVNKYLRFINTKMFGGRFKNEKEYQSI